MEEPTPRPRPTRGRGPRLARLTAPHRPRVGAPPQTLEEPTEAHRVTNDRGTSVDQLEVAYVDQHPKREHRHGRGLLVQVVGRYVREGPTPVERPEVAEGVEGYAHRVGLGQVDADRGVDGERAGSRSDLRRDTSDAV